MLWYNEVVIICTVQKTPTGIPPPTTTLLLSYKKLFSDLFLCQETSVRLHVLNLTSTLTHVYASQGHTEPFYPSPGAMYAPSPLTQLLPPTSLRKHRCSLSLLPSPNTQCPTCPASTPQRWPHFHMKIKSLSWHHKHSREKRCILSYPIYQHTISKLQTVSSVYFEF